MGQLAQQISNIPLTYAAQAVEITDIKGCKFTPAVYLATKKMYLILVSVQAPKFMKPEKGFYDVPEKNYLTWIESFKPIALSHISISGHYCYIWEAIEGTPPKDFVPVPGFIRGMGMVTADKIEVKHDKRLIKTLN
jgi:hypothetical protein